MRGISLCKRTTNADSTATTYETTVGSGGTSSWATIQMTNTGEQVRRHLLVPFSAVRLPGTISVMRRADTYVDVLGQATHGRQPGC